MPDRKPQNPGAKGDGKGSVIPGVDALANAQQRASRRMTAVQRTPMGRRILGVIRNLAWVVPLTVLVWLYAEREQVDRQRGITIPVTVLCERTDRLASVVEPHDRMVSLDIEGTRARIEQARQELKSKQGIQLVVPAATPAGSQVPLPALEAIATLPVFADRGIAVTACTPSSLVLRVDEVVSGIELHPQISPEIARRLEGPVQFDPPVVIASGPKRVLADPASPPELIADITEQMLPKVAGPNTIPAVAVHLKNADPAVKLDVTTVKAHVRLPSSTTTYVLNTVPVFVMGPPALLDKYSVVFPPPGGSFISRVTVVGPEDEINLIKSNEFVPKAVLEIKQEDAREGLPRAPSSYILPPHVVVSEEDRTKTITFKLVERSRLD